MIYTPTIWENGKKPAINATHLNKIENELAKLDNIVSMPDITETTETTMPNSYDGRLMVEEIGGVCEQNTTSGKNLFGFGISAVNATAELRPNAGQRLILTKISDNEVKCNYNGGSYSTGYIALEGIDGTKAYKVSYKVKENTTSYAVSIALNTSYSNENRLVLAVSGANGETIVSSSDYFVLSEIQVEVGTEATLYEPYTGGIPSPNPNYPQEIKKTVVSEIKTHGKNLLDLRKGKNGTGAGVTFTKNDNGSYLMTGTATDTAGNMWFRGNYNQAPKEDGSNVMLTLYAGKSYYISDCRVYSYINGATISRSGLVVPTYDIPVTGIRNDTLEKDKTYNQTIYPMIVEGDTLPSWEPYTESVITLSQPIELYGIGDVQDVIEDGKIKRRFAKNTITSANGMDSNNTLARIKISNVKNAPIILCDKLSYRKITSARESEYAITNYSNVVYVRNANIEQTVDAYSEWLSKNPITVVYELAEEVIEDLPIADQIALNSLKTYDGITYLEFDSEIEPTFKGEYGTSKVGGYTLEGMLAGRNGELYGKDFANRITALETTVVNNI